MNPFVDNRRDLADRMLREALTARETLTYSTVESLVAACGPDVPAAAWRLRAPVLTRALRWAFGGC